MTHNERLAKVEARQALLASIIAELVWNNQHILVGGTIRAQAIVNMLAREQESHAATGRPASSPACPCCGSDRVCKSSENAVGNTHDCLKCGHDFTPSPASRGPSEAHYGNNN